MILTSLNNEMLQIFLKIIKRIMVLISIQQSCIIIRCDTWSLNKKDLNIR
jgi:hypothetical protein